MLSGGLDLMWSNKTDLLYKNTDWYDNYFLSYLLKMSFIGLILVHCYVMLLLHM